MDKKFQCGNSIQIGDILIGFSNNQSRLLNTTYFGNKDNGMQNCCLLHTHLYTEIFACGRGSVTIKTIHKEYKISAGEIAVIPSRIFHAQLKTDKEQDAVWGTVGVVCSFCKAQSEEQLFSKVSNIFNSDSVSVFKTNSDFYSIMTKAVKSSSRKPSLSDIIRFAGELCSVLVESFDRSEENTSSRRASMHDFDRLFKLDLLLNANYMHNITNKQLADELFLSERQLSRFVNRYYGVPLHILANNKRIEAAATMLQDTSLSIEQIASQVGFSSKSGFYREFVKRYGKTPLRYRKSYLKSSDIQEQI